MPSPSDESQSALRSAELNPLLNPLLSENMGRWAEVYFTSPPEKREQAVLELLRELEAKNAGRDGAPVAPSPRCDSREYSSVSPLAKVPSEESLRRVILAEKGSDMRCNTCGRDNPASHQFCGMCGSKLGVENEAASPSEDPPAVESVEEDEHPQSDFAPPYLYTPGNANRLSLFQDSGPTNYDNYSEYDYEPAPSPPYRIYLGVALALILAALGYMAWRSAQASQTSQGPLPAPPAAAKEVEPPTPAPREPADQPQAAHTTQQPDQAPSSPADSKKQAGAAASSARIKPAEQTARPAPASGNPASENPASENSEAQTQSASASGPVDGSEELSIAQRYLNGMSGQRRDTAEAAKWLWKSIAKHNSGAAVLLADLYLKGDGVSKNCDQARVLLDSAARKGIAGAGERLRNLQAFGCQ